MEQDHLWNLFYVFCHLLFWQAPVQSNGKIRKYDIRFPNTNWETVTVNNTDLDSSFQERKITVFRKIDISDSVTAHFDVIAHNAVGKSPEVSLVIPKISQGT